MMPDFFDQAFDHLMKSEGLVYINDPTDSGGPTKYGVTQKAYEEFLNRLVPIQEMKDLTIEEAKRFYRARYWGPLRCEYMEKAAIAFCIFDASVLYGPGTAAKLAQRAVSLCGATIKFDGIIGDKSLDFLNAVGTEAFLKAFHGLILKRIDSVIAARPKDEKYRKGWTKRADRLLALAQLNLFSNDA